MGEFTRRVKQLLEGGIAPCWVRGEISNLRRQASGHVYFTLKDDRSQLSCVLFKGDAMRQTVNLRDGLAVLVYGEVSVYEPRGTHQLICRAVQEEGEGRLRERFERLKAQLAAEGLFDADRKRALPVWPRTVAVVTSPSGAAIQDFSRVLERRGWRGYVAVVPAKVQGEGAAGEVVAALERVRAWGRAELVVVMRGGGSLEDLWCFNEEAVARAVAACPVPVISAVGHEIDFTLSDFAADRRAETPTAAAELISSQFLELVRRWENAREDFSHAVSESLRVRRQRLDLLTRSLALHHPQSRVEQSSLRLDELRARLDAALRHEMNDRRARLRLSVQRLGSVLPERQVRLARETLARLEKQFIRAAGEQLRRRRECLAPLRARLEGASLHRTLARGFAVARDQQGNIVTRKEGLHPGDPLALDFHDGEIITKIEKV